MVKYDSYKNSGVEWIGEVPSHWIKSRLKFVSEIVTGNTPPTVDDDNYDGGEYLWVKPNEINGLYPTNDTNQKLTEKGKSLSRVIPPYSVLVNGIGRIGEFGFSEKSVSTNQQINSIIFDDKVDNRYGIYHVFMMKEGFISNSEKVVVPILNKTKQENINFILPPLHEQHHIVQYLDTKTTLIDTLIQKTQEKINLLREKRTSLINHTVTKGLNPNVEMKDSGVEWIGEIPKHWEISKIKHVCKIFGRIGYRGYTIEDIVDEGEGVITISPSNIRNDCFTIDSVTYISYEKYYESPEIMIFTGDIILVKTGSTIGKTSIIPENVPEMTINPQLVVLKEISMYNKYLFYQTTCKYIKESFDVEQTGSTTPTISQEKIYNFPILIPSVKEQHEIVEFLDDQSQMIDNLIQKEEKRVELLKEYCNIRSK